MATLGARRLPPTHLVYLIACSPKWETVRCLATRAEGAGRMACIGYNARDLDSWLKTGWLVTGALVSVVEACSVHSDRGSPPERQAGSKSRAPVPDVASMRWPPWHPRTAGSDNRHQQRLTVDASPLTSWAAPAIDNLLWCQEGVGEWGPWHPRRGWLQHLAVRRCAARWRPPCKQRGQ